MTTRTYARHVSTRKTPQSEPIPGREKEMVKNYAGGFTFELDQWSALRRFLILGTEGGTYYASERKLTKESTKNVLKCIKADCGRVIQEVVTISDEGLAHKNDPAIFVLSLVMLHGSDSEKNAVVDALPKVARTGTHLVSFVANLNELRGWGRTAKRVIANWYTNKPLDRLAYQMTKYQARDGWSHRDILRLAHVKPVDEKFNTLFRWAVGKKIVYPTGIKYLDGMHEAMKCTDDKSVVKVIEEYGLTREMIPTQFLKSIDVWDVLLQNTPMTALIRNLGNLSDIGYLTSARRKAVAEICGKITDAEYLQKSRIHPVTVLLALDTYAAGHGFRGKKSWTVVQQVVDALDEAFYMSFKNVEPTGKQFMLGVDVSSSMSWAHIQNSPLTAAKAAGAMAMVTARTERDYVCMGFCDTLRDLKITPRQRMDTVMQNVQKANFGSTDCSLPMKWAMKNNVPTEVFVIYTDNETGTARGWGPYGQGSSQHPAQTLREYRQKTGIPAKLVVVAMTSTGFTIADPTDAGMLDVVGFDASVPQIMRNFVLGV